MPCALSIVAKGSRLAPILAGSVTKKASSTLSTATGNEAITPQRYCCDAKRLRVANYKQPSAQETAGASILSHSVRGLFCAYCPHSVFATWGVCTLLMGHAGKTDRKPFSPKRHQRVGITARRQANRSHAEALGLAGSVLRHVRCYCRLFFVACGVRAQGDRSRLAGG